MTHTNAIDLPDNIRIPLHELQADSDYLFGRVANDPSVAKVMSESVKAKLATIELAIWSWVEELTT